MEQSRAWGRGLVLRADQSRRFGREVVKWKRKRARKAGGTCESPVFKKRKGEGR